jgi:transposase
MAETYSLELEEKVTAVTKGKGETEAAKVFKLHRKTIYH